MHLDLASNIDPDEDEHNKAPSCCCFLIKVSILPSTWKPLKHKLLSFICFLLSILSIILFITSMILSLQLSGYPTHSSSTPGLSTSFVSFIFCFYSCYILYYFHQFELFDIHNTSKSSALKSFYLNFFFFLFLSITGFITIISGIFIKPSCLWYTYGSIPGFIASSIAIIILFKNKKSANDSFTSLHDEENINSTNHKYSLHSLNGSDLEPPPNNLNINNNNKKNDEDDRKCCCNKRCCLRNCCLRCCCPITLCIMALLLVIQACFSANSPSIQGDLYSMQYAGYTYNLQALCKGSRTKTYNFTIILSHGGGANSVSLLQLQDYLSTDYRVCVYTRPGYAWSDAAPFGAMGNTNYSVVEMMDLMENKLNEYEPYVIIGHSVGGQIAKNAAFFNPDKVIGIILLDSVPDFRWQMIDSNGTYDDCVDVFNGRMELLSFGRYFTSFGGFRPFLGSQHEFGQYQDDEYWAVNLDSMWNSQWIEMEWQSLHYKDLYNMENILLEQGILGDINLLSIPAGLDENCTQAHYSKESQDCIDFERKQHEWSQMHFDQKNASNKGQIIVCPYPCKHNFAWTKADWINDTIQPFLKNITKM